jgi:hypothetical protein
MRKMHRFMLTTSAIAAWPFLMGCADPTVKDPMTPQEYIAASAKSLKSLPNPEGYTTEQMEARGVVYERRGPGGVCGEDPLIHGPQDRCHPKHKLYEQIRSGIADVMARDDRKLSGDDAERVALAAFWCATYTHIDRVDSVESWPADVPWIDRLITMTGRASAVTGDREQKRAIAVVTGLGMKHNSLIYMIRWVDRGLTIDRVHEE